VFDVGFPIDLYDLYGTEYGVIGNGYVDWHSCRESFRGSFAGKANKDGFLFAVPNRQPKKQIDQLKKMATALQDKMALSPEDRFVVEDTKAKNIVYIKLSKLWQKHVRLEFLTAFLRAAKNPARESLEEVLRRGKYLMHTKPAVERFVSGHFLFKKNRLHDFCGWMDTFRGKKPEDVRKMLVRKKRVGSDVQSSL